MTDPRPRRETDPAQIVRVTQSEPSLFRPRMNEDYEARLYESDRERARAYAAVETMTEKLRELADDLIAEEDELAIPIVVEPWDDTSLVHSIIDMQQALVPPARASSQS